MSTTRRRLFGAALGGAAGAAVGLPAAPAAPAHPNATGEAAMAQAVLDRLEQGRARG